ncbi:glycosyltransferase [Pseudomonadales bacterium]|nr:glycosyltransferase [Pseudomonadales bacterium]
MKNNPLISVVMSVFNDEKFVSHSIRSIVNQSYRNFEFIIVNDGSSDGSRNIILDWKKVDDRIVLIDRKNNRGLPHSLNEGIAIAKGVYIARMDSDDIALKDRFEMQLRFLEANPVVDIVGGQVSLIDSNGIEFKSVRQPLSFKDIKSIAKFACPMNHPTYMVKKKAYSLLKGYREAFVYAQDYDLILRAIDRNLIIENMPDVLLHYRFLAHETSAAKVHRQLYLGRQAILLHKQRVNLGFESAAVLDKANRTSFYAGVLFSFSWGLRKKALDAKLPSYLKYFLAFISSVLHYEVFYDSVRGFRLKLIRAKKF